MYVCYVLCFIHLGIWCLHLAAVQAEYEREGIKWGHIKFTDNVFGRVEYRYTDFGSATFDNVGKVKDTDNRIMFGVGMKF